MKNTKKNTNANEIFNKIDKEYSKFKEADNKFVDNVCNILKSTDNINNEINPEFQTYLNSLVDQNEEIVYVDDSVLDKNIKYMNYGALTFIKDSKTNKWNLNNNTFLSRCERKRDFKDNIDGEIKNIKMEISVLGSIQTADPANYSKKFRVFSDRKKYF